jgi:hypothetical protein
MARDKTAFLIKGTTSDISAIVFGFAFQLSPYLTKVKNGNESVKVSLTYCSFYVDHRSR